MLIRIIDCETTGLDQTIHRVCEIATVDMIVDGTTSNVKDHGDVRVTSRVGRGAMWSCLVNPGIPIPPEASAVHDITNEMVANAPKIGDLMETIINGVPDFKKHIPCLPPDYWCAHNNRFDMQFINPPGAKWIDTYRIALWLWPSAPEHKLATLRYWLKLNLDITITSLYRAHSAFFDAYICAAVLRRAFMTGATIEQMLEVSSQPALLPRLTFGKHAMKPIEEIESGYLDWLLSQRDMNEDVKHTAFAELQRRRNLERLKT